MCIMSEKVIFRYDSGILNNISMLTDSNKDINFEDHTKGMGSWNRGPGRADSQVQMVI